MKSDTVLILNGPGLADLEAGGDRQGSVMLEQIREESASECKIHGLQLEFRQTDDQDEMFHWITGDSKNHCALIINPAGNIQADSIDFEGYGSALRKAAQLNKPVIEVHISNIFKEETGQTVPLQGPAGEMGFVCGMGRFSYLLGIQAVAGQLQGLTN